MDKAIEKIITPTEEELTGTRVEKAYHHLKAMQSVAGIFYILGFERSTCIERGHIECFTYLSRVYDELYSYLPKVLGDKFWL